MPSQIFFGAASAASVTAGWIWYLSLIPKEKVPKRPIATLVLMALGILLGIDGIWFATTAAGQTWAAGTTIGLSATGISLGLFFVWLYRQAPLPAGEITVEVGGALPKFTAIDQNGAEFNSGSLEGQRTLLKFFRGSW